MGKPRRAPAGFEGSGRHLTLSFERYADFETDPAVMLGLLDCCNRHYESAAFVHVIRRKDGTANYQYRVSEYPGQEVTIGELNADLQSHPDLGIRNIGKRFPRKERRTWA